MNRIKPKATTAINRTHNKFYLALSGIIEDQVVAVFEPDDGLAKLVAALVCEDIADQFGGQTVYLATSVGGVIAGKHDEIFEEFDGGNYRELARKHNVSITWIKRVLRRGRS